MFLPFVYNWHEAVGKKQKKRIEILVQLLPLSLKKAERSDLGVLLELAPRVLDHQSLANQFRDVIARLLARTPTDELQGLTEPQREGLRLVTIHALKETVYNTFYDPLAIAGLLTLGTLGDPGVLRDAQVVTLQQPPSRVCAAADEYLNQLYLNQL